MMWLGPYVISKKFGKANKQTKKHFPALSTFSKADDNSL